MMEIRNTAVLRKHFVFAPEQMHNVLPFLDAFDIVRSLVCLL